jgi:hypothetical protein
MFSVINSSLVGKHAEVTDPASRFSSSAPFSSSKKPTAAAAAGAKAAVPGVSRESIQRKEGRCSLNQ